MSPPCRTSLDGNCARTCVSA